LQKAEVLEQCRYDASTDPLPQELAYRSIAQHDRRVELLADAAEPSRPRVTGLSHVALFAHDMEQSRHFYKDFLGFAEPYSLTNFDGSLALTFIKINDRQVIELFPEKEADSDRLNHIAVETDDAEAMALYAGEGVGLVHAEQPAAAIVSELAADGSTLLFSTFNGGAASSGEEGRAIVESTEQWMRERGVRIVFGPGRHAVDVDDLAVDDVAGLEGRQPIKGLRRLGPTG